MPENTEKTDLEKARDEVARREDPGAQAVPEEFAGGISAALATRCDDALSQFQLALIDVDPALADVDKAIAALKSGMELLETLTKTILPMALSLAAKAKGGA